MQNSFGSKSPPNEMRISNWIFGGMSRRCAGHCRGWAIAYPHQMRHSLWHIWFGALSVLW